MPGKRIAALIVWTAGFGSVVFVLLVLSAFGDCRNGPEGVACWQGKHDQPRYVLVGSAVSYVGLTWLFFFRRRGSATAKRNGR
jgi:hypothetical protein